MSEVSPQVPTGVWVFTRPCGHPIAVTNDHGYSKFEAFWEIYGDDGLIQDAIDRDRITVVKADWDTYTREWYPQMGKCACPAG